LCCGMVSLTEILHIYIYIYIYIVKNIKIINGDSNFRSTSI